MNRIVEILMRRDGLDQEQAQHLFDDVKEMVLDSIQFGDYDEPDVILREELGLEPDYLVDLIGLL